MTESRIQRRQHLVLLLLFAICAAPFVAATLAYYVFKPSGSATNYGTLINPQRPIPATLMVHDESGRAVPFATFKGKWLMLSVSPSACDYRCVTKLYAIRQVRAAQGVERERIVGVWLRTDQDPVPPAIRAAYSKMRWVVADRAALTAWLAADADPSTHPAEATDASIYLVDPNGNLMMRFPPRADPSKIKNDLAKLLKWSRIG